MKAKELIKYLTELEKECYICNDCLSEKESEKITKELKIGG